MVTRHKERLAILLKDPYFASAYWETRFNLLSRRVDRSGVKVGMFDYVTYKDIIYQTKSLDSLMDNFEITWDGELYQNIYRVEDRSDPTKVGLERIVGMMTRIYTERQRVYHTGEILFYRVVDDTTIPYTWEEYSAYFFEGTLKEIHKISGGD